MTRDQLPARRAADVLSFEHESRRWTANAGRFADGHLAKLFIDAPKESPLAGAAREDAILASFALQHGASVDTSRDALDGRDVSPIGRALALFAVEGGLRCLRRFKSGRLRRRGPGPIALDVLPALP